MSSEESEEESVLITMNLTFEYGKVRYNLLSSALVINESEDIDKALEVARVNFKVFWNQGIIKSVDEGGRMMLELKSTKQNKLKRFNSDLKHLLIVEEKIYEEMTFNDLISLIKGWVTGITSQTLNAFMKQSDPF